MESRPVVGYDPKNNQKKGSNFYHLNLHKFSLSSSSSTAQRLTFKLCKTSRVNRIYTIDSCAMCFNSPPIFQEICTLSPPSRN